MSCSYLSQPSPPCKFHSFISLHLIAIAIQSKEESHPADTVRTRREREREQGMRLLGAHRAALLVLACVVVVVIHGLGEAEALGGGGGFVRAQGTRFVLDGNPYYANGFNAYWLMLLAADPSQRGKVTAALGEAAGHGLTVARTWAFSDGGGGNALQLSPGNYNENTFKVGPLATLSLSSG